MTLDAPLWSRTSHKVERLCGIGPVRGRPWSEGARHEGPRWRRCRGPSAAGSRYGGDSMLNRLLDRYQRELARRPAIRRLDVSYRRYYELGMHRTASAATYYAVLTLFPFLSLLYLLLAQWVQADPAFLRRSRQVVQNSLGLSSSVVAKLLNAEGSASLHAF